MHLFSVGFRSQVPHATFPRKYKGQFQGPLLCLFFLLHCFLMLLSWCLDLPWHKMFKHSISFYFVNSLSSYEGSLNIPQTMTTIEMDLYLNHFFKKKNMINFTSSYSDSIHIFSRTLHFSSTHSVSLQTRIIGAKRMLGDWLIVLG